MKGKSFTWIYIKRSFTKNLKKQLFLILGIAAFMVMATVQIISVDSYTSDLYKQIASQRWGYDIRFESLSYEQRQVLLEQPEVLDSHVMDCFKVSAGVTNANYLVSAEFPDSFLTEYVYGDEPKKGEVALPESARIAGKRPEIGQEIVFEIQVGNEKQNVAARVSGVFEEHFMYNAAYIAMYGQDFEELLKESGMEEQGLTHVFVDCGNIEKALELWRKMMNLYGMDLQLEMHGESDENLSNWRYIPTILSHLQLSVMVGAISMIAIIYIVLKDERTMLGIFRALGATKRQMLGILSARMAVLALAGAGLGTVLGGGILLLKQVLMKQTEVYKPSYVSLLMIPLVAVVLFLVFQLPGALYVLRSSETELMRAEDVRGKHLISYKNRHLRSLKHPFWWYSGLETKRVKRNVLILCLVTASSLMYVVASLLQADYRLESSAVDAVETDYAVSRSKGTFTKEEIEAILQIDGVSASGYGAQVYGENLVKWNGISLCAKVQIIEENSFYEFKVTQARTPRLERFKGTLEEALAGERILVEPTYHFTQEEEMLAGDTMYIRNAKGEEIPFEIATVGGKKNEGTCECYVYISFETYEKLFGMPELTKFHVMFDGIDYKEAKKEIEGMSKLYSVTENEILVGHTERQLKWDEVIVLLEETLISLLISFSFLFCYSSFYFLSKKEEYWMLYAQGASKKMLQKIILY
ncbi:MAG: FtsX-like permease family protein, partial [Lachnospiraceae bacterium]